MSKKPTLRKHVKDVLDEFGVDALDMGPVMEYLAQKRPDLIDAWDKPPGFIIGLVPTLIPEAKAAALEWLTENQPDAWAILPLSQDLYDQRGDTPGTAMEP